MKKIILLSLGLVAVLNADVVKEFYPSGKIKSEINKNEKGLTDGLVKKFYENGNLKEVFTMGKNSFQGEYKSFYENGKIKEKINFSNGLMNGDFITYSKDGKVAKTEKYKYGEKI